jgi:hypothetical protein
LLQHDEVGGPRNDHRQTTAGVSGQEIPNTLINLGISLQREGRYAEAEQWMREGIEIGLPLS